MESQINHPLPTPQDSQEIPPTIAAESIPQKSHLMPILFLLLLMATSVAGYLYYQNQQLQNRNLQPSTNQAIAPTPTPSADPTISWPTYEDPLGFSFRYPPSFTLNQDTKGKTQNNISVRTKDLSNYQDEPLGYDAKTAINDQLSLKKGLFGEEFGSIKASQKVIRLSNDIPVKSFTILRQIEVCNVQFTHTAIFYYRNHQVIITTSAPLSLAQGLPTYFTSNEENCGDSPVWKDGNTFFSDLQNQKAPQPALDWYQSLDQILSTFKFADSQNFTQINEWNSYSNTTHNYTIKYPNDWNIDTSNADAKDSLMGSSIKISQGNYVIYIAWPSAFGPSGCYFDDQNPSDIPIIEPCIGEFVNIKNGVMRRLAKPDILEEQNKVFWNVRTKELQSGYYVTVPPISYEAPPQFDPKVITVMDAILETFITRE